MSEDVRLNAEVTKADGGRVVVSGQTNLPDKTNLLITLSNEAVGFTAQDKATVGDGRFSAGPFGQQSSGLSAGHYTAEIVMPIPRVQPTEVQAVIGDVGQHLTGTLVQDASVGGKVVRYSISYTVGSEESIQQAQSEHESLVSEVRSEIELLLMTGRAMEQYRNTDDLAALRACGEKMRANQERAKMVRERADTLPMSHINLKVASIDVHSCVSCSGTAMEACERVEESLDGEL
jgi:hypothetical protein